VGATRTRGRRTIFTSINRVRQRADGSFEVRPFPKRPYKRASPGLEAAVAKPLVPIVHSGLDNPGRAATYQRNTGGPYARDRIPSGGAGLVGHTGFWWQRQRASLTTARAMFNTL
jgi:hypothetical protein